MAIINHLSEQKLLLSPPTLLKEENIKVLLQHIYLYHALPHVPVDEGPLGVDQVKLVAGLGDLVHVVALVVSLGDGDDG